MTKADVAALLELLGPSPALKLRELGIRARPSAFRADGCPVAVYLQTFGVKGACVGVDSVDWEGEPRGLPLPEPVRRFISRFDRGDFPELK